MVESEFTPASFPESIWSLGTFTMRSPLPKDEVERRLVAGIQPFSIADGFGFRWETGYRRRTRPGGFQVWRRTYWTQSPHQGASLWDFNVTDTGVGSELKGVYRLGYALIIEYALLALFISSFVGLRAYAAPWPQLFLVGVIGLQLLVLRMTASRGLAAVRFQVVDLLGGTSADKP